MKKLWIFLVCVVMSAQLMAATQAVVFDFGGVMSEDLNREMVVKFLRVSFNLSEGEFDKVNKQKHLAVKQGKTEEQFWLAYAEKHEITLPANWEQSFKQVMKKAITIRPGMYALVSELKAKNMRVALLSNVRANLASVLREMGLYEPFDPCLLSCEMGVEKPDLGIYQTLIEQIAVPAKDIVFIDDKAENIEAAKNAGLDAIPFESQEQVYKELSVRGVL